ncbi:response regulator [Haloglycomyces albus]|uniref:response regulator n=1 Tax=Haloglycomyces albus TaxID=526067 RepID=UPI00046CF81B|nr:response regulator transcription factor [Haloglycomyces albus]
MPTTVVMADDQGLIRMALSTLIAGESDLDLVAEVADGEAAWEAIRRLRPNVALLDIRMPRLDGIQVLRRIAETPDLNDTRVVMMTTFDIDEYIFDAVRAGAAGYVMKDTDPAEILQALRLAAAGDSLLSPTVARKLIDAYSASHPERHRNPHPRLGELTDREHEILRWVATGLPNEDISDQLYISPATVRTHVGRILTKLNARDRAALVAIAYQAGLDVPAV